MTIESYTQTIGAARGVAFVLDDVKVWVNTRNKADMRRFVRACGQWAEAGTIHPSLNEKHIAIVTERLNAATEETEFEQLDMRLPVPQVAYVGLSEAEFLEYFGPVADSRDMPLEFA